MLRDTRRMDFKSKSEKGKNEMRNMLTCTCDEDPLYSKIGVYRGMHFFLIFALKHRLWVLVRTCTHDQCLEQK